MSRGRARTTARADSDIKRIALWIASQSSVDAALRWSVDLDQKFESLARTPGSGTDRGTLGRGLRSSPFGRYLIFFRAERRGGIVITRVIHGAQDYGRFFKR
jgi:plasmid stabilization system protein ParE